jgi:hypothetical protein
MGLSMAVYSMPPERKNDSTEGQSCIESRI